MRDIRFRAWDGEKFGYVVLQKGSIHVPKTECLHRSSYDADSISFGNIEDWQQYTDIKDENNTDICEGDIISFKHDICDDNSYTRICKIILGSCHSGAIGFHAMYKQGEFWDYYGGMPSCSEYKVTIIGNIHANPEILGDPHEGH